MSEETRVCRVCGRRFTWGYDEQRWYREHGLEPPKRCRDCRRTRRDAAEHARYRPPQSISGSSVSSEQQWAEALRRAQSPPASPPAVARPASPANRPVPQHAQPAPQWNWPALRDWIVFGALCLLLLGLLFALARSA